jgi:hypothetical protein
VALVMTNAVGNRFDANLDSTSGVLQRATFRMRLISDTPANGEAQA